MNDSGFFDGNETTCANSCTDDAINDNGTVSPAKIASTAHDNIKSVLLFFELFRKFGLKIPNFFTALKIAGRKYNMTITLTRSFLLGPKFTSLSGVS